MALRSRSVAAVMRQHWRPLTVILAVGAMAFGVAFIPFVLIYVPVRSIAPLRSYQEYLLFALAPANSPFWRQCQYHRRNAMLFSSTRRGHPIISIKPMRCGFRCEPDCRP